MEKKEETFSEFLAKSDLHGGHRKRIYERACKGDLCAHERLELILFSALPRRNTNDLAHLLLSEFGSIRGVLNAPVEQLCRVPGIGESVACFLASLGVALQSEADELPVSYPARFTMEDFLTFMHKEYESIGCEVLDVYILDDVGRIYGRKRCSSLREKKVEVQLRWLMNVLLDFNPSGIVLVHNHPCGDSKPSQSDDYTTEECKSLCGKNGVIFCDHLIYSPLGIYSYNYGKIVQENEKVKGVE